MIDQTTGLMLLAGFNGVVAVWMGIMWCGAKRDYRWAISGWRRANGLYDDAWKIINDLEIAAVRKLVAYEKAAKDERSRRVSKGNRTRYAKQRALVAAKTAELNATGKLVSPPDINWSNPAQSVPPESRMQLLPGRTTGIY